MDSDRILLLDSGEVKEFEKPDILLADHSSTFYAMAKDAGLV
jgi:ABC-type multidrug transport system fused ATPase/permease subunit